MNLDDLMNLCQESLPLDGSMVDARDALPLYAAAREWMPKLIAVALAAESALRQLRFCERMSGANHTHDQYDELDDALTRLRTTKNSGS